MAHPVRIIENSLIAKIAAKKLKCSSMAVTLGNRIYLHNASRDTFLGSPRWLRHELQHVQQFRQYGFLPFLFRYLLEAARNGYHNNKWEREARAVESDVALPGLFDIY